MDTEQPTPPPKPARKPFGWPFWLILVAIIAALSAPSFMRGKGRKIDEQNEQTSNSRQIGLALLEFDNEYGTYPNDATAKIVKESTGTALDLSGKSSNAIFRQLFALELTQSEQIFYAPIHGAIKPDGITTPGEALKKGEVGFAYIAGLTSAGHPARPIIFAPVIPGTKRFDPEPFGGNAVFLRCDNSATSLPIQKDGRVLQGGIDILSAENPIWDGKAPDIRYPE